MRYEIWSAIALLVGTATHTRGQSLYLFGRSNFLPCLSAFATIAAFSGNEINLSKPFDIPSAILARTNKITRSSLAIVTMKCESCGNELTGGAIICRVCNHNNALRGDWRSQRGGQQPAQRRPGETQPNQSRATSPLTELPRIVPRKDADANLIRFPPVANKQESRQTEITRLAPRPQAAPASHVEDSHDGSAAYPPWRAELKERVRQIREKRNTGELVAPSPPDEIKQVDLDRNPIVESALNRIRWSPHLPQLRPPPAPPGSPRAQPPPRYINLRWMK